MRKKSESTIIEMALGWIPWFDCVFHKLQQQVILPGQSKSALHNYRRRVATISLHFGRLPELITND